MNHSTVKQTLKSRIQTEDNWERYIAGLKANVDLEATAREHQALIRRREVRNAEDLLRMCLAYAVCDWPLWKVAQWSTLLGIGDLSNVAVMKRLQKCESWLKHLVARQLRQRWEVKAEARIRMLDGSVISRPGSKGTNWRIHLGMDMGSMSITDAEVTDASGGESIVRFPIQQNEIVMGDRGYAYRNSIGPLLSQKCPFIVRCNWHNVPMKYQNGERVDIEKLMRAVSPGQTVEHAVWIEYEESGYPVRLLIAALPQAKAVEARRKLEEKYKRKGKTPQAATVLAAGCTLILTNLLLKWPAQLIVEIYHWRWQIELYFKWLKSIWHFDKLRARGSKLATVYLLAKLLAVLLMEPVHQLIRAKLQPSAHTWSRPVSEWKLHQQLFDAARDCIAGSAFALLLWNTMTLQSRLLKRSPRRRRHQLALAANRLANFPAVEGVWNPLS